MDKYKNILDGLSSEQKEACTATENLLLTACPGSGKTLTLTRRLAYIVEQNEESLKWNIAITYTNRAAEEIINRLDMMDVDSPNVWTGTIHQFCMQFIIRPYAMYSTRLSKGYSIIDEYVKKEYGKYIAQKLGIKMKSFEDPFAYPKILAVYRELVESRKEIDFDMILQLSEDLISQNSFICNNIGSTINSLLIDEYQDTNERQHSILAQIFKANKSIKIMFVGDANQAIYGSLGGVVKNHAELETLYRTPFRQMSLTGCYRSTQRVIELYKHYEVLPTEVHSVAKIKDVEGIAVHDKSIDRRELTSAIATIINSELDNGTKPEEICILAPQWIPLFALTKEIKIHLSDIPFDAPEIAPIKYDPLNPLYLISKLLFMPKGERTQLKKRIANEFLSLMKNDLKLMIPNDINHYDVISTVNRCRSSHNDGVECLKIAITSVCELLNINWEAEHAFQNLYDNFFSKIDNRIKSYSLPTDYDSISRFYREKKGIVITTIHSVKGEEYNTVIAINLLNGKLPHWGYICSPEKKPLRRNETFKLLYVLLSRAKSNVYLFSEKGYSTEKGAPYVPTEELSIIANSIEIR